MTTGHIQHDQGSQDFDPGLQEKSLDPFCVSFAKDCTHNNTFNTGSKNFPLKHLGGTTFHTEGSRHCPEF